MRRKNILLLINQLYGGGAQKVIANLSIQLQNDYNIFLVIYNDIDKVVFPYAGELIKIKLPFSDNTANNNFFKRSYRSLVLIRKLRSIKKKNGISVSISFMEASNIANILSHRNERLVLSVRSYLSKEFLDHQRLSIFKNIIRLIYNRADCIVAPSEIMKSDLIENFGVKENKVSIVYNFVDIKSIKEKKNAPVEKYIEQLLANYPVIANVGRIVYPKAQWLLPGILKRVKEKVPNAKLLIIGEGPLDVKILEEAQRLNLSVSSGDEHTSSEADIYLPGFRINPYAYLSHASLFIMSSVYEGFPNVLIEAMASGLPVVSSDCTSGPREILNPGSAISHSTNSLEFAPYGILTPVFDDQKNNLEDYLEAASNAVTVLLTNHEKRNHYIKQSLARATNYDREIIMRQWIQIIESNIEDTIHP